MTTSIPCEHCVVVFMILLIIIYNYIIDRKKLSSVIAVQGETQKLANVLKKTQNYHFFWYQMSAREPTKIRKCLKL